jgi:8-hydroxy-5-deazaflavin:NADPH oxidoreductase
MNIGIIGAGNIGATAAKLWLKAGHSLAISNSRGPETLTDLVKELGSNAKAVTVLEAAQFGEVVLEAIPFGRYASLPAKELEGKILISAANYYPQRDGDIDLGGLAQTEFIAKHLPSVHVVKAFNTIYYQHLATMGDTTLPLEERIAIYIAGDNLEAKTIVANLIRETGFAPVDTGLLANSKVQEPGAAIYNNPMKAKDAKKILGLPS